MATETLTRRSVHGNAFRDCEFCGRAKSNSKDQPMNYQYINEKTGEWDTHVFCSKVCYSAWHCMNDGR
ncbi:MAG: hypothetical protein ACO3FL_08035 [Ilumatobacteraceae bacterium]|jgi:glutaredoxin